MTGVQLRVNLFGDEEMGDTRVVANVYPAEDTARRGVAAVRNRLIPAGDRYDRYESIDLPPGRYVVEVDLPSGRSVSSDLEVGAGEPQQLQLEGGNSPHEWMAWQHLVGNVGDGPTYFPDGGEPTERWWIQTLGKGGSAAAIRRAAEALDAGRSADFGVGVAADPQHVEVLWAVADRSGFEPDMWQWLATLIGKNLGPEAVLSRFAADAPLLAGPSPVPAVHQERRAWAFRFEDGGPVDAGGPAMNPQEARPLALVRCGRALHLASLPVPWIDVGSGRSVPYEILVAPGEEAVGGMVHDPSLGSLVGYMGNRFMHDAQQLLAPAEEMLFHKVMNPLGSAAGAYVLVGSSDRAQPGLSSDWPGWIQNLRKHFPWLPDGAIARGQYLLQNAEARSQQRDALDAFLEGYGRGLPYYALGASWLLDGLTVFLAAPELKARRAEVERWLSAIRTVVARTNLQQPFTTIRLTADRD